MEGSYQCFDLDGLERRISAEQRQWVVECGQREKTYGVSAMMERQREQKETQQLKETVSLASCRVVELWVVFDIDFEDVQKKSIML